MRPGAAPRTSPHSSPSVRRLRFSPPPTTLPECLPGYVTCTLSPPRFSTRRRFPPLPVLQQILFRPARTSHFPRTLHRRSHGRFRPRLRADQPPPRRRGPRLSAGLELLGLRAGRFQGLAYSYSERRPAL